MLEEDYDDNREQDKTQDCKVGEYIDQRTGATLLRLRLPR